MPRKDLDKEIVQHDNFTNFQPVCGQNISHNKTP